MFSLKLSLECILNPQIPLDGYIIYLKKVRKSISTLDSNRKPRLPLHFKCAILAIFPKCKVSISQIPIQKTFNL